MKNKKRYIAHVDMDAFFTSVEQRDNIAYRNKPVIVGSDPKEGKGRGVVAACSYKARKYGIHSAMPISIAYKKCPDAVFLTPDMNKYVEVSHQIFDILETFTPDIEPISIDEAFLDITHSYHLFGSPKNTCQKIKNKIKKLTGLTASVGLAPNKMTAKIASDEDKPDGLVIVTEEGLLGFLHRLAIGKLWGIGKKTEDILKSERIKTIGDLAQQDKAKIISLLGKNGLHIWESANGIDAREVETASETKSIGNEFTFEKDITDKHVLEDTIMFLSEKKKL